MGLEARPLTPPLSPDQSKPYWLPLGAMVLVQMVVSVGMVAVQILAPLLTNEYGTDSAFVGLYASAINVSSLAAILCAGFLISRYGAARVSQLTCLSVGCGLLLACVGTLPTFILCALLAGAAMAPETPASTQFLTQFVDQSRRGTYFSIKQTGRPLGLALAGVTIPLLVTIVSWRLALGALGIVAIAVALLVEPLRRRFEVGQIDRSQPAHGLLSGLFEAVRSSVKDREMLGLTLCNATYYACTGIFNSFYVIYLVTELGYSLAAAGSLLSTTYVVSVIGRLTLGNFADRLMPPKATLIFCGLVIVAVTILLGLSRAGWPTPAIVAITIFMGFFGTAWNGIYVAEVARLAPAGRAGALLAATMVLPMVVGIAVPPLFGLLAAKYGYEIAFIGVAAMPLLGIWGLLRSRL